MINKYAPIVPYEGMGGVLLNWTKVEAKRYLGSCMNAPELLYDGKWSRYQLDPCLSITFDERSDRLFRITAWPGYAGTLESGLGVGCEAALLMEYEPTMQYDDDEDFYLSKEKCLVVETTPDGRSIACIAIVVRDYEDILKL